VANRILAVGTPPGDLEITKVDRLTTIDRARAALPEMP
jgi:hypothetical protein